MSMINENAINALPFILKRLSSGENLCMDNLIKDYDAPRTTLRDNINKHIVNSFPNEIKFSKSTNTWTSDKNFLSETLLTAEEIITMSILENSISKYGKEFERNAKLLFKRFKRRASVQIYKKTNFEQITRTDDSKFALIKNAIKNKIAITCIYRNKLRLVFPLKIVMFDGYWYALVFQKNEEKIKTFHLKSIENITNTNEYFSLNLEDIAIKLDSVINAYFEDKKPINVELFIYHTIAKYFERKPLSKNQTIDDSEDENYKLMRITVTSYMEIIPTIQQFLPFIKVISPDSLEQKVKEHLGDYGNLNLSHYDETD